MHFPDEAMLSREGFGDVLEVVGVIRFWEVWDVLCLAAFASSMKKGLMSKPRFWDMYSVIAHQAATEIKTKLIISWGAYKLYEAKSTAKYIFLRMLTPLSSIRIWIPPIMCPVG